MKKPFPLRKIFIGLGTIWGVRTVILEEYQKAIECFEKALAIKKYFHEACYNMGNAYDELGKHQKVIDCYEKALTIKADLHQAWNNMGNLYGKLGEYQKAIDCCEKAYALGASPYNLAYVYALQKKKKEVLRYLEEALKDFGQEATFVRQDEDWKAYWDDPYFKALVARYGAKCPFKNNQYIYG